MAKKSKIKNDFAPPEEDIDVCGFDSEPNIDGDCIASFSFDSDDSNSKTFNVSSGSYADKINEPVSAAAPPSSNILSDNRKTPIANGMAPPVDGEYLDVKRTYMLRESTVRKVNELKSLHPDINTYVSTIVDAAISYYYEHIVNGDGKL